MLANLPTRSYTPSLHDALPIFAALGKEMLPVLVRRHLFDDGGHSDYEVAVVTVPAIVEQMAPDRKSTRLNSSHLGISYAVFCSKNKSFLHHTLQRLLILPCTCR